MRYLVWDPTSVKLAAPLRALWSLRPSLGIGLCAIALVSAGGCKPEISRETYFCGPEGFCPPNLACQYGDLESFSYNCVLPRESQDFSCPEQTADLEPDDELGSARPLGDVGCGEQLQFQDWGCIADATDTDHFAFTRPTACNGANPRARITLRYPVGSAPLRMLLLDDAGETVASSELCTPDPDSTGTDLQCIESPDLPPGDYRIRVELAPDGNADCEGSCAYNRYQIVIASPVT